MNIKMNDKKREILEIDNFEGICRECLESSVLNLYGEGNVLFQIFIE